MEDAAPTLLPLFPTRENSSSASATFSLLLSTLRWLVCFQKEKPERDRVDVELLRTICCCFFCLSRFSFLLTFLQFSILISLCVCFQFSVKNFVPSVLLRVYSGYFFVLSDSGVDSVLRLTLGALSECVLFCSFPMLAGYVSLVFVCADWLPPAFTVNPHVRLERSHLSETEDETSGETNCEMRKFLRMFFECAWKSRQERRESRNKLLKKILCRYYVKVDWKVLKLFIRLPFSRTETGSA